MKAMGINPKTTLSSPATMNLDTIKDEIDFNTMTKPEILFEKK